MSVTQINSSDLHPHTGYLPEVHSENQKREDLKKQTLTSQKLRDWRL